MVSLTGTAAGNFANKNVGNGKAVTITGLSLTGADAGNYTLVEQAGLTANITAANITVSGLTSNNKVYDATTTDTLGGTASITPLGSDVVSLTGTAAGNFADKNVGNGKAVTISGLSLLGADAGNYTLVEQSGLTANVTAKSLTASLTGTVTKTYDGTTTANLNSGNYSLSGVLGSDFAFLNNPVSGAYDTKNIGTGKTVSVNGLALLGADAGNYALTSTSISAGLGIITAVYVQSQPISLPSAVVAYIDQRSPQQAFVGYASNKNTQPPKVYTTVETTQSGSISDKPAYNDVKTSDMQTSNPQALSPQAGLNAADWTWWDEVRMWWRNSWDGSQVR